MLLTLVLLQGSAFLPCKERGKLRTCRGRNLLAFAKCSANRLNNLRTEFMSDISTRPRLSLTCLSRWSPCFQPRLQKQIAKSSRMKTSVTFEALPRPGCCPLRSAMWERDPDIHRMLEISWRYAYKLAAPQFARSWDFRHRLHKPNGPNT